MSRDRRREGLDGEGSGLVAPAGAPGRATRTQRLPARTTADESRRSATPQSESPVQLTRADDAFGLHLESAIGASPVQRQSGGIGEARESEGGHHAHSGPNNGPSASFLSQLSADNIVQSPHPLLLEKGKSEPLNLWPQSEALLPAAAPPVPVWCKLINKSGESVSEVGGQWQPGMAMGPLLQLEVPPRGAAYAEIHVNAGRPGARVLKHRLVIKHVDEDTKAADLGDRLHDAAGKDARAPSVSTYRDMLAAVLAAKSFTEQGDDESYRHALGMLRPVDERLHALRRTLHEKMGSLFDENRYGFSAQQQLIPTFEATLTQLQGWRTHLASGHRIDTETAVNTFRSAEDAIKLATGEVKDLPDMRSLDKTAPVAIGAGLGGMAAGAALGIAAGMAAPEILGLGGATSIGTRLAVWAASDPATKLFIVEFLVGMGISIGDQGVEDYLQSAETPEDLLWAILHAAVDAMQARQGRLSTGGGPMELPEPDPVAPRRRGGASMPESEIEAPTPGAQGNAGERVRTGGRWGVESDAGEELMTDPHPPPEVIEARKRITPGADARVGYDAKQAFRELVRGLLSRKTQEVEAVHENTRASSAASLRGASKEEIAEVFDYVFDSHGIKLDYTNYAAWRRIASKTATTDDLRFLVHELEEIRRMRAAGLSDPTGRGVEPEKIDEWRESFSDKHYPDAHRAALEAELEFMVGEVARESKGALKLTREEFAMSDPVRREARDQLDRDGVRIKDHPRANEWNRAGERVSLPGDIRARLGLSDRATVAEVLVAIKMMRKGG